MANDKSNKRQRIFHDPPGVDPEPMTDSSGAGMSLEDLTRKYPDGLLIPVNLFNRWKMMFMGIIYLFLGGTIWVMVNLLDITVDIIIPMLVGLGLFFVGLAMFLYKQTGERRFR
jgi:hypothetical protein